MNINSIKSFNFPTNKFGILVVLMILCFGQSLAQEDFDGITYAKGKKGISFKKNGEMITAFKPKMEDVKVLYRTYKRDFPLLYIYQLEGKWGVIKTDIRNYTATILINAEFDAIDNILFNGDLIDKSIFYFVVKKNGKSAILTIPNSNTPGNYTISEYWDEISNSYKSDRWTTVELLYFKNTGKYGITNYKGKTLVPAKYDSYKMNFLCKYPVVELTSADEKFLYMYNEENPDFFLKKVDSIWNEVNLWWIEGKDTMYCEYDNFKTISDYRKEKAKNEIQYAEERKRREERDKAMKELYDDKPKDKYTELKTIMLGKTKVYIVYDSLGIRCFDAASKKYLYQNKRFSNYWTSDKELFLQTNQQKWVQYPFAVEYDDVTNSDGLFFLYSGNGDISVMGPWANLKNFTLPKGARVTQYRRGGYYNTYIIYTLNGKYSFISYGENGVLVNLPNWFDKISIIYLFQEDNPRLMLQYKGQVYHADYLNITRGYAGGHSIKCDMYGVACGNSDCKDGVTGYSTRYEGGKTTEYIRKVTNTGYTGTSKIDYSYKVIERYTEPVKTIRDANYCKDPQHDIKNVFLSSNGQDTEYEIQVLKK